MIPCHYALSPNDSVAHSNGLDSEGFGNRFRMYTESHGIVFIPNESESCIRDNRFYESCIEFLVFSQWCLSTRDHSKALGDVPGYNRWERLALGYSHDLDMLRVRKRDGLPPPQHHYEVKTYAIVQ